MADFLFNIEIALLLDLLLKLTDIYIILFDQ